MSPSEPFPEPFHGELLERHHQDVLELIRTYGAEYLVPDYEWLNLWRRYRVLREGMPDRRSLSVP